MINPSAHLYLVSAQATPNITPALDKNIRPEKVVLLVSPDMKKQAQWLADVLKEAAGTEVTFWEIDHPWNISHVQERVLELLVELESESIALNATGGTKPMSIGAYEVFRSENKPIFYVHPERDELVWLFPSKQPSHQLENSVKLRHFMQAHGSKLASTGSPSVLPSYKTFAQTLIDRIEYFGHALGVLNWYASTAQRSLTSAAVTDASFRVVAFRELLDALCDLGMVSLRDRKIVFIGEGERFFANGGWLEQYVFAVLNSLKEEISAIQDTASNLVIVRGDNVTNELDVAFLAENRLHIIECKTRRFKKEDATSGKEALYKLDSLTDAIGGLKAKALLISYQPLNDFDRNRAKEQGVTIFQGNTLKALKKHMEIWINEG